jgi:hypothetical protein
MVRPREDGTFGTFDPVDADRVSEDLRVRCVAVIERSRSGQGAALNALVMESAGHILASDHTG